VLSEHLTAAALHVAGHEPERTFLRRLFRFATGVLDTLHGT